VVSAVSSATPETGRPLPALPSWYCSTAWTRTCSEAASRDQIDRAANPSLNGVFLTQRPAGSAAEKSIGGKRINVQCESTWTDCVLSDASTSRQCSRTIPVLVPLQKMTCERRNANPTTPPRMANPLCSPPTDRTYRFLENPASCHVGLFTLFAAESKT
jgi:hypothetical protein